MTFILGLYILMLICLLLQEVLENCRTVCVERDLRDALLQLPSVLWSPPAPCGGARQGQQRQSVAAGWEMGCDSACSLHSSYPNSLPLSRLLVSFYFLFVRT